MRVLIVGAGLAGLSLYRLLNAGGHEVRVIERAEHFGQVGYGIVIWGGTWRVLERLGVADAASRAGVSVSRWEVRDADGRPLRAFTPQQGQHGRGAGQTRSEEPERPFAVIHRGDLHDALRAGVPDGAITMGTSIRSVEQDTRGVTVTLTDGSRERADLLVGADGVHSRVRQLVFGTGARDLGTAAWAFWVPDRVDLPDGFTELWGRGGRNLLVGGVAGRRMATVGMPLPPNAAVTDPLAYLRTRTGEWLLPQILHAVEEAGRNVFFDRNRQVSLARFHRGRVVLLGDAAHAVHPIVGMGASLALEDTRVLADQLRNAPAPPQRALEGFTRRRRGPVRRARLEAAFARRLLLTRSPAVAAARDLAAARTPLPEGFFARQSAQLPDQVSSY